MPEFSLIKNIQYQKNHPESRTAKWINRKHLKSPDSSDPQRVFFGVPACLLFTGSKILEPT
jgi:hypothetical protein